MLTRISIAFAALFAFATAAAQTPAPEPSPLPTMTPSPSSASPAATNGAPAAASAAAPPTTGATTAPVVVAPDNDPLAVLSWMHACWAGKVNQREFTEQWTAPAAGMMLGLGHTVLNGKTLSFEFMRIETRADGKIAYVAKPTDKAEEGFVYEGTKDDRGMTSYIFSNPARDFPSQIIYQRTPRGDLFAYVKGKINGADREVIYPFHAVDCASGKVL